MKYLLLSRLFRFIRERITLRQRRAESRKALERWLKVSK
jgi:hypothetical protein